MTEDAGLIKVGNWPVTSCGQQVGFLTWITERLYAELGADVNGLAAAAAEAFPDSGEPGCYVAKVGGHAVKFHGTRGGAFVGDCAHNSPSLTTGK